MTSRWGLRYIESVTLLEFCLEAWCKTPEMRMRDAYKWLFQATMGGEHAIGDDASVRAWMDEEWATIGEPFPNEPMIEPLTPNSRIVRVNLRPYKWRGLDKDELLDAFLSSALRYCGEKGEFLEAWKSLGAFLGEASFGYLDSSSWRDLDAIAVRSEYPAMHHSAEYEAAYFPAYRVLLDQFVPGSSDE